MVGSGVGARVGLSVGLGGPIDVGGSGSGGGGSGSVGDATSEELSQQQRASIRSRARECGAEPSSRARTAP